MQLCLLVSRLATVTREAVVAAYFGGNTELVSIIVETNTIM